MSFAEESKLAKATFYVHWYDVGESALEGLKGVKRITKGFLGTKEINAVHFDPAQISIEQMVESLQQADAYIGTVK